MNYLVQRGKVRQQAISVPDGLPELLSDITREVLRCQPSKECLCQFIIDYLHSVIVTREKAMVAKSILDRALRLVDEVIADMCVCDISKEKSDIIAQAMEECFRNFLERRRCEARRGKETVSFDQMDLLGELIAKCQFTDFELEKSRPVIENAYKRFVEAYMAAAEGTDGTEALYQYFRDRELKRIEELIRHEAATKIQAAFRGYRVRSSLETFVCTCTCMLDEKVDEDLDRMDHAARVIQRFFRSSYLHKAKEGVEDPCEPKSQEDIETTEPKSEDGQEEDGEFPEVEDLAVAEAIEEKAAILSNNGSAEISPVQEAPKDDSTTAAPEQEALEMEEQNQPPLTVEEPPEPEASPQAEEAQELPAEEMPHELEQLETEIGEAQVEEVPEAVQAEEAPEGEPEN